MVVTGSTLRLVPAHLQSTTPNYWRASCRVPGPDLQRQATASPRNKNQLRVRSADNSFWTHRREPMNQSRPALVVGIDGSQSSEDALRWAADQARLTGAELHAVTAWQTPAAYGYYTDYPDDDAKAAAEKTLEQVVSKLLGIPPSVPVVASVVKAPAAEALVDVSRSAELLVVGSRGGGTFAGMSLGSVSQRCVQHSACPVVVVRHRGDETRSGRR